MKGKTNMTNKHTQGPWRVILAPTQIVTDDKIIANVNKELIEHGESLANAHLIAAAPELLAFCVSLSEGMESQREALVYNLLEAENNHGNESHEAIEAYGALAEWDEKYEAKFMELQRLINKAKGV